MFGKFVAQRVEDLRQYDAEDNEQQTDTECPTEIARVSATQLVSAVSAVAIGENDVQRVPGGHEFVSVHN